LTVYRNGLASILTKSKVYFSVYLQEKISVSTERLGGLIKRKKELSD